MMPTIRSSEKNRTPRLKAIINPQTTATVPATIAIKSGVDTPTAFSICVM